MTQQSSTDPRSQKPRPEPPRPPENVRLALAALALRGPSNISGLLAAAGVVGARESEQRAFSTESLRVALGPYLDAGWVRHADATYSCDYGLGPSVLRSFEPRALEALGARYMASLRQPHYVQRPSREALEAQVRLGLAGGFAAWPAALEQLLRDSPTLEVTAALLHEPLTTSERAWFARFPAPHQSLLSTLLLEAAEVAGLTLGRFEGCAIEPGSVVQSEPELRARWARLQLLRAGALSSQVAEALPASSGVAFLLRMVAGEFSEARRWLSQAFGSKRVPLLAGAAGVLQVLLLLRGERPGDLDEAARLATSGARAGNGFKESFGTLKRAVAALGSRGAWVDVNRSRPSPSTDVLFELVNACCTLWFPDLSPDLRFVLPPAERLLGTLRRAEATWLTAQYEDVVAELHRVVAQRAPLPAPSTPAVPPLRGLFVAKPAWEAALGRLEGLAIQVSGSAPQSGVERLAWRVSLNGIEPYLQRATATGWTRGRKLALKHLLPGAAQRQTLAPEDLRVAEHVRESVLNNFGYREIVHAFDRGAWDALIGHPRVFEGESDLQMEVVRGTVQLLARAVGDEFQLEVHPAGLSEHNRVVRELDRYVVYSIDQDTQRVLEVIGEGLVVPVAQRERLLSAAARLTHLVPLQSSEPSLAEARPGDATPYLRLTPRGAGLTVALRVRPLGERGPALMPGVGAPVFIAQVDGSAVQASRELAREAELAELLIADCGVLEGQQVAPHDWLLESPEDCLELLATLVGLGERVRVEWPHGKPLVLRGRLDRSHLRGSLRRGDVGFFLEASLSVDAELELPLAHLLRLFGTQQGRFVRLEQGDYLELTADLREQLSAISAARSDEAAGDSPAIALPPTALAALEGLASQGTAVELDAPALQWRTELAKVFDSKPRVPRTLNAELRDYQVDGFRWLARLGELGFGACLADDMGLGKTVQLIALLLHRSRSGPALVVAPTSVCENWSRELQRFAPSLSVVVYSGTEREQLLRDAGARKVVVTGYATLQQDAPALQAISWGTVILDEAQFIKNAAALRTKAALGLRAGMRVAATGTPVENHAEDLYSLFQFVQPGLFGNPTAFRRRFPLGEDSSEGRESRRKLRKLIQPFLLRRTKAQVLKELPPVTEIEHQVELSSEETVLYEAVRRTALDKLGAGGEGNKIAVLAELTRLRRLCCDARLVVPEAAVESSKLKAFQRLMEELVDARHRVLVFSQFVDVLKLAGKALEELGQTYQYLDGSSTAKQRAAAVDAFQAGEGDAFLISLKAGGFGLNLTAADYVIHLDPWWNPAAEAQATDRAHRIGQQNPVTLYRLVAKGTIEERIVSLHRTKRELADSLLAESDQATRLSSSELRALLELGVA